MIRLNRANGYQHISPDGESITYQILELPGFVAAALKPGKVISFHP
jgi:hypothetical protein